VKKTNIDILADCWDQCKEKIEGMARKRGHCDPASFVGEIAMEVCTHPSKNALFHQPRQYLFWLSKQRLRDYHRLRAARQGEIILNYDVIDPRSNLKNESDAISANGGRVIVLRNILGKLNPKHREILERKHLMGQSTEEIATAVAMTSNSVRSVLYRSITQIRKMLLSIT
jgi:RNA polymerase sigma factor (sigma-70 family)